MRDIGFRKAIDGVQRRMRSMGAMVGKLGVGMLGGGAAALAPMVAAIDKLGELSKMKDAATALGMTGKAASGLFGVLAQNGGDFKEDLEGVVQFSGRLRDALAGVGGPTGEAARLFEGLSVSAKDLEGVPLDEQFYRVLGAIRELPQEMQAYKLSLMGGTDSMKKWLPLLARSEAEIRAQAGALSSSEEELQAAKDATLAYKQAMTTLGLVWQKVAVAVAPVIEMVANGATSALRPLAEFVGRNKELIIGAVALAAGVAGLGAAFIAVGVTLSVAATAIGGIVTAIGFLLTPTGLSIVALTAAVAGLAAGFVYLTGVGSTLGDTFAGVMDALSMGDLELAWSIGIAGLRLEWVRLVEVMTGTWGEFKSFFVDGWHSAIYLVRRELSGLQTSMAVAIVGALTKLEEFIGKEGLGRLGLDLLQGASPSDVVEDLKRGGEFDQRRIDQDFARAQASREAARKADLSSAVADRQAAEAERARLIEQARVASFMSSLLWGNAGVKGPGMPGPPPGLKEAMGSVRGGFAGFGSLQSMFGGGATKGIEKKLDKVIEKHQDEIDVLKDLAEAFGDINGGVVWGA